MADLDHLSVAVVGAGLAGLAAARALVERGARVRVLDKARGPAGRTATRHAERFDFDHGAQYFTARMPAFRAEVEAWRAAGIVAPWSARLVRIDAGGRVEEARPGERFVGVPGMNAMGKHLARDLDLTLDTRVARVERTGERGGRLALTSAAGAPLGAFDRVVLALPPAQAAPLCAVEPELAARVRAVEMRPCQAVMLGFDEPVAAPWAGAFVERGALAWAARNTSKPGRPGGEAWVLHATPGWSEARLDAEPGAVVEALVRALREHARVPRPVHAAAHLWRYAVPAAPLAEPALAAGALVVCGDWCGGPRVEGAWTSGRAAAELVRGRGGA